MGFGLTEILCKDCKDYGKHLLIFEVSQTKARYMHCMVGAVCFMFPFHCINHPDFIFQDS